MHCLQESFKGLSSKYMWYQLVSTDLLGEAFQVGEKSMALGHPIPKLSGDRHTNNEER